MSSRNAKEPANLTHLLRTKKEWLRSTKLASLPTLLLLIILSLAFCFYVSASSEAHLGEPESDSALVDGSPKRSTSRNQPSGIAPAVVGADVMVHEREFVSPQVKVQIECQRDKTIIKVNFSQPFSGTLGAGKLDTTQCKLNGNGTKLYELQVKHNSSDCDTQWDSANSSIFNTLFIRFHPSLETGGDLAKNVMCRLTVGDLVVGRRPLKTSSKVSLIQPSSPNQQTDLVMAPKNTEQSAPDSKMESSSPEINV